jgi:hypothetical protein
LVSRNQSKITCILLALTWKPHYPGSNIFSWNGKDAVDLYIVGYSATGNLTTAVSDFGFDPSYRLNLAVEPEIAAALQAIMDDGSFEEMFTPYSPLKGQSATFSVKFKTLQRSGDLPDLKENNPFLFDGRTIAKVAKPALQDFLAGCWEFTSGRDNTSTFDMSRKGDSSGRRILF